MICAGSWLKRECTDATTMSSCGEAVVGEIQRSVLEDVALDAGKEREPVESPVQAPDARGVFERAALVESVGHGQRLAVIGDGDVLEPAVRGRLPPSPRSCRVRRWPWCACAGRRGCPQPSTRRRQAACLRPLELAAVLTQFGRQSTRARAPCRCLPRSAPATRSSSAVRKSPYSLSVQAEADGPVAQSDVVRLGAGEVLHGRAPALRRHKPQIGLVAPVQPDTRLRLPVTQHALDLGMTDEHVHQFALAADGEDVEVAAGLDAATKAADRNQVHVGERGAQVLNELVRQGGGLRQQVPSRVLLIALRSP